jgi:hypothetical protein
MVDISARSFVRSQLTAGMTTGIALTAAGAIAFTPLVVAPDAAPRSIPVPHVGSPSIDLTAVVTPEDLAALVTNLDAASDSVSSTVASLAGAPGQTLVDALNSAVGLNNTLWDQLIGATPNPALINVLTALRDVSNGGLSELAATAGSTNDTVTLSTGQVASLLTSTLTGAVATAQHAVAIVTSNPLAAASYTGLLNVPLNIAGLGLNSGLAVARDLGVNGLGLGNAMVHGVTAQIPHIVSAVNDLASKGITGAPLIDGALIAVQAIALMPVTVGVAGVNGLSDTLTEAGSTALTRIANGAAAAVTTWLGNGTDAGAVQAAINRIGADFLSPAAYADAASVLVGAVINTGKIAIGTAGSMASLPIKMGAGLTNTGADMIKTFNTSMATAAAGLMHAAGLPPYVSHLPHTLAGAVNGAITVAAFAASATLNGIASAIDIGNTITGAMPAQKAFTLSVASDSPALTANTTSEESVSISDPATDTHTSSETQGAGAPAAVDAGVVEAAEPEAMTPAEESSAVPDTAEVAATTEATKTTVAEDVPDSEPTTAESAAAGGDTQIADDGDVTPRGDKPASQETAASEEDAPAREPAVVERPSAKLPDNRKQSETEDGSDTNSESTAQPAKKADTSGGGTLSRSGTAAGGKHAVGNVENATSVSDIKNKLDKETTNAATTADAAA